MWINSYRKEERVERGGVGWGGVLLVAWLRCISNISWFYQLPTKFTDLILIWYYQLQTKFTDFIMLWYYQQLQTMFTDIILLWYYYQLQTKHTDLILLCNYHLQTKFTDFIQTGYFNLVLLISLSQGINNFQEGLHISFPKGSINFQIAYQMY